MCHNFDTCVFKMQIKLCIKKIVLAKIVFDVIKKIELHLVHIVLKVHGSEK